MGTVSAEPSLARREPSSALWCCALFVAQRCYFIKTLSVRSGQRLRLDFFCHILKRSPRGAGGVKKKFPRGLYSQNWKNFLSQIRNLFLLHKDTPYPQAKLLYLIFTLLSSLNFRSTKKIFSYLIVCYIIPSFLFYES